MSRTFLTTINLSNNSLLNGRIDARWAGTPTGTTNPDGTGTAVQGQLSSYLGTIYVFNGTAWAALSTSSGTVTSVTGTSPVVSSGGNTPAISLAAAYGDTQNPYASKTANFVLAAPNGSAGAPSFRALVAADLPTLATLTFGTGLTAGGSSFNGSAPVTITAVSATTSVAGISQLSDSISTTSSTLAATATAAKAAYDRGSLGVTNAATAQSTADGALQRSTGGTMGGAINMGSQAITNLLDPVNPQDATTKNYVDGISAGVNAHDAVKYATTGALGTSGNLVGTGSTSTYSNGTAGVGATLTISTSANWTSITIDGQSLTVGDRVLIKDQGSVTGATTSGSSNGIYTVTTVGTTGNTTSFVFTRAVDNDQVPELGQGDLTYVIAGTSNVGNSFVQTAVVVTVGTSTITWSQFSGPGTYTFAGGTAATGGVTKTGNAVTVDTTVIRTTGTQAIGNGLTLTTPVLGAATATSINGLTISTTTGTLTLVNGSTLATSGANSITLTSTGSTNVTLPTSGTLMTTAGNTTGSAATLTTAQNLWGQSFNGSAAVTGAMTGVTSVAGTTGSTLAVTQPSVSTSTGNAISLTGGASTNTTGTGGNVILTGGAATTGSLAAIGGQVNILGGASNGTAGTGGSINLAGGSGSSSGGVYIGRFNTSVVEIGDDTPILTSTTIFGTVLLPQVAASTAGFVKTATDGTLSRSATVAYSELPTNVGVVARKVSLVGTGSGTTIALTHGLGTNLVHAQVYDTSTSTATLVEVDITVTSTVATATFAATTTLSNYTLVVVG